MLATSTLHVDKKLSISTLCPSLPDLVLKAFEVCSGYRAIEKQRT
jgi:hypothetical protein